MATNQVYDRGKRIPIAVPAGVVSGAPVAVGSLVGVALIDRKTDGTITLDTTGVWELTVTGAITLGAPVYAVVAAGLVTSLTATDTGNTRYGTSLTAQAATGVCKVMIRQP